jgi:cytidine deaminase
MKIIGKRLLVATMFLLATLVSLLPSTAAQARARYGSHRVGGYTSHGKGSHYVGGYVRW